MAQVRKSEVARLEDLPALLTVAEVAEVFRLSDETIHRWAREGRLRYVDLLGVKRFRRDYIVGMLEAGMPEDDEPAEPEPVAS